MSQSDLSMKPQRTPRPTSCLLVVVISLAVLVVLFFLLAIAAFVFLPVFMDRMGPGPMSGGSPSGAAGKAQHGQ